ncbi:hypothetical protein [Alloscardovia macacae]|uniref:TENA/THI-4 family protein n=1 Tax=Alloscardovia macacae TaxID=1160091 RepID=A0A261F5G2_9BIFI|nr:hypothetical protein [Alloscardovia macacae]OZG54389.1 TENA/THI-4 family protein [Alloscardovia macacae]
MTFMTDVHALTADIWEDSSRVSFLTDMGEGRLDKERFCSYIIQDSLYLRDYARAYAYGLIASETLADMQIFGAGIGAINDVENTTRLDYLADFGLTDADVEKRAKLPECAAYTEFLLEVASEAASDASSDAASADASGADATDASTTGVPEILAAVMPCAAGYYAVFQKVLERYPAVLDSYYGPLVADYTSQKYGDICRVWSELTDRVCAGLPEERLARLREIYRQGSLHELYFWQMASRGE